MERCQLSAMIVRLPCFNGESPPSPSPSQCRARLESGRSPYPKLSEPAFWSNQNKEQESLQLRSCFQLDDDEKFDWMMAKCL